MKCHTKYIGRPYRCRRCEQQASERWWWTRESKAPHILRVAYFCSRACADGYTAFTLHRAKQELLADILATTLIGTHDD